MRAVVMVLRVRFRQYWKPWLALSLLVAVAGGFVLSTASAGHRTADAFPGFVARHGYDVIVYSGKAAAAEQAASRYVGDTGARDLQRRRGLRVVPQADRHQKLPGQRGAAGSAAADGHAAVRADAPPVGPRRGAGVLHPGPGQRRTHRLGPAAAAGHAGRAGRGQGQAVPGPASGAAGGGHRRQRGRVPLRRQPALRPLRDDRVRRGVQSPRGAAVDLLRAAGARGRRPGRLRRRLRLAGRLRHLRPGRGRRCGTSLDPPAGHRLVRADRPGRPGRTGGHRAGDGPADRPAERADHYALSDARRQASRIRAAGSAAHAADRAAGAAGPC